MAYSTAERDSADECLHFEKESFGTLRQMLSALDDQQQQAAWAQVEQALGKFEGNGRFIGPCELVRAADTR